VSSKHLRSGSQAFDRVRWLCEEVVLGNDGTPPDLSQLFDYSKSAGYFSQLAGVLAGFAFLAITLLLNRQHRRGTNTDAAQEHWQDSQIVTALGCALLGLVAAAAMYALLAGEQGWALTSGRGLSRFMLAAVAFVFSLYTAFFAAVQLVSAAALGAHDNPTLEHRSATPPTHSAPVAAR
jgi:hypothetical protein